MTGGQAFVWDPELERLLARLNTDLVEAVRPDPDDLEELRWLVERHVELTGSARAAELLRSGTSRRPLWHILPKGQIRAIEGGQAGRVTSA